ncbi:MAG: hypothetical protein KDI83_20030, partial [Gammaproteobacteria bacterium]|nr:hypothetical protein [Gammaproteobacteria bacterium]
MTRTKNYWQRQSLRGVFLLFLCLLGVESASASLLGIPTVFPRIAYAAPGSMNYLSGSGLFSLDATPVDFFDGAFSINCPVIGLPDCPVTANTAGNQDVTIRANVGATGTLLGGVPGDDLVVTGKFDANGDGIIDYDGVLLTGEVSAFGFQDSNPAANFDFRFTVTGGLLASNLFLGKDIGVTLLAEVSNFSDFLSDFNGSPVKGAVMPIPPQPRIDIEKYTNGQNADDPNDGSVPQISPNGQVIWTYAVENVGLVNIPLADITVTDSVAGVNPVLVPDANNADGVLSPGEVWYYEATGTALDLGLLSLGTQPGGAEIVPGCNPGGQNLPGDRNTYENIGRVEIPNDSDTDPSHYCNPPPTIDIEKTTDSVANSNPIDSDYDNEDSANDFGVPMIPPGANVTWTYKVTNTGTVAIAASDISVTDSVPGVVPVLVPDVNNADGLLSPGEIWFYQAAGVVQDLGLLSLGIQPDGSEIVLGCNPTGANPSGDRNTYRNIGMVEVPGAMDSDPSHYCNTPPDIDIQKLTESNANENPTLADYDNEDASNGTGVPVIPPGAAVTWVYKVTNTGQVAIAQGDITVTDSVAGVNPVLVDDDDGDGILSPGEIWFYEASGIAQDLSLLGLGAQPDNSEILLGCNPGGQPTPGERNTYRNMGTVTIPDDMDSDPSHYCNPAPVIAIEKTTDSPANINPVDSDYDNEDDPNGPGVPVVAAGADITWTYKVTNIGDVAIAASDIVVTDSVVGVNPVLVADGDGDSFLSPGEVWFYEASGAALDLTLPADQLPVGVVRVPGCNPGQIPGRDRLTYVNVGVVAIPGSMDDDLSHYCNAPNAALGDTVWEDSNGNGLQDEVGTGVPGVTITLTGSDGSVDSKVTDGNGNYLFPNLVPGVEYTAVCELPAGYSYTTPAVQTAQTEGDNNADNTGNMGSYTLASGESDLSVDCGLVQAAS